MKRSKMLTGKTGTILLRQKGSDAGEENSPKQNTAELDQVYDDYVTSLSRQTAAITGGQQAWQAKVA